MERFNVCHKRTYTTKQGEEKTSWPRIGVAFQNEKGVSGTIEQIPVGWDGRFVLFPADDQRQAPAPQRQAPAASDDFDDQIPF